MTVRHQTTKLFSAMKEIQNECAAFYRDGIAESEKSAIIQNIWRTANFGVIEERKRRRTARKKVARRKRRRDISPADEHKMLSDYIATG